MNTPRPLRALLLGMIAASLTLSLSGCITLGPGDAPRDEDGNIIEGGTIDIFALKVGDCIAEDGGGGEVTEIKVVPCSEPHSDEVYYEFTMPDGAFPSDDAFDSAFFEKCIPAFENFVGISVEETELAAYPMLPTEGSWEQHNDRVVQCLIYDPAGDISGSLRNAQR